jgi:16S rRNA (guanine527-N7)-methyltransferase
MGKKIRIAETISRQIQLNNVECKQKRVEDEKGAFDFIVSRAVMPVPDLVRVAKKNIARDQQNALPNGFLCLKGGDLQAELKFFRNKAVTYDLEDYFEEEFFKMKKVIYLPN